MNHAMWHDEHEHVILMQCIKILGAYKVEQEALQVLETWDATTLPTYKGISSRDSRRRTKKLGVLGSEMIFAFPCSFINRVV